MTSPSHTRELIASDPEGFNRTYGLLKGDVVIDGGGECGDTTLVFRQRTVDAEKIYVFDPMDAGRADIAQCYKASDWANVEITSFGPGNETGEGEISERRSRLTALEDEDAVATQHIETITLDAFVQNNGQDRVDFIKMDMRGQTKGPA